MSSRNILELLGLEDEVCADEVEHLAEAKPLIISEEKDEFTFHLEITVNLPLTAKFRKLGYVGQVECYKRIWEKILNDYVQHNHKANQFYIENTKQGFPHLHGYITLIYNHPISPKGLVMDVSKVILKQFTRGQFNKQFCQCNYNDHYERFKSAGTCINFKRFLGDRWLTYITKEQKKRA